jgi:uncharacterized protein (DUF3820 family)
MSSFAADVWVQLQLRPIEAKLLRLAIDPAAQSGEIATSAEKLINCLRARGVSTAEVFRPAKAAPAPDDLTLLRARNMRMPFGKHRRKRLCDVPLSYLRWAKNNAEHMSSDLRDAISLVLKESYQ